MGRLLLRKLKAVRDEKLEKVAGPSKVCVEMISASAEIKISVMIEAFHRVLNGKGMRNEYQTNLLVPIFEEK